MYNDTIYTENHFNMELVYRFDIFKKTALYIQKSLFLNDQKRVIS